MGIKNRMVKLYSFFKYKFFASYIFKLKLYNIIKIPVYDFFLFMQRINFLLNILINYAEKIESF